VPPEYLMGEREVYLAALQKSRESYSKNGLVPAAGAQSLYNVLRTFDPAVKEAAALNTSQTFDNTFVQRVPASTP
jgi:NitT/TauT family transport system substrate-binding protein